MATKSEKKITICSTKPKPFHSLTRSENILDKIDSSSPLGANSFRKLCERVTIQKKRKMN